MALSGKKAKPQGMFNSGTIIWYVSLEAGSFFACAQAKMLIKQIRM